MGIYRLFHLCLLLAAPLGGIARSDSELSSNDGQHHSLLVPSLHGRAPDTTPFPYTLQHFYQGYDFLNPEKWFFFSDPDPTHGRVNYQPREAAQRKYLAYVEEDRKTFRMSVDDTNWLAPGAYRDSVRISSTFKYNGGLFIADFKVVPYGCSVWPAWWSVGPEWPAGGEIDVLEGVHNMPSNQYTVHTNGERCNFSPAVDVVGRPLFRNGCPRNCGISDPDRNSYGRAFNEAGGGVFAHLWNDKGIKMWHFPRNAVPADITTRAPNPNNWPKPAAIFSSKSCDMRSRFWEHVLVLDTTLCGEWGEGSYAGSGCSGTCAQAIQDPRNYRSAKWAINYIAVYQPRPRSA